MKKVNHHDYKFWLMTESAIDLMKTQNPSQSEQYEKMKTEWVERSTLSSATMVAEDMNFEATLQDKLGKIKKLVNEQFWTDIAINASFKKARNVFKLKQMILEVFEQEDIEITLYGNNLTHVEVNDIYEIQDILFTYHSTKWGGHCGVKRMHETINKMYKWPNMLEDIKKYVKNCEICEKTKYGKATKMPLQITSTAERPFQHIFCDYVGPIKPPGENQEKYIFTMVCDLTKYLIAVPTLECDAITAAKCIVFDLCLPHGFPDCISSDNGAAFQATMFKEITKRIKAKQIFSTVYNPRSHGAIERQHRTLNAYLRAYTAEKPTQWSTLVQFAVFAYNNTLNTTTGYCPQHLARGYPFEIPNHLLKPKPIYTYENFADVTQAELSDAWKIAAERILNRKATNKKYYDKKLNEVKIKVGDRVLVKNLNKKGKFDNVWKGPFDVIEVPRK